MKKWLRSKRAWILTLVFLLLAGIAYANYTLPDGRVVRWLGGNMLEVTNIDGSRYVTEGIRNNRGRLVPADNSVRNDVREGIPAFNEPKRDGMDNIWMTVPIFENGKLVAYGDTYGDGETYVGNTPIREYYESRGYLVEWTSSNSGWGGGVINITPNLGQEQGGPENSGTPNGNSDNTQPAAPHVTQIVVSGPTSLVAGETYMYTATAYFSDKTWRVITSTARWRNGPRFSPENEGDYTITAQYGGLTGSLAVHSVLPPPVKPLPPPKVRLY